MEPQATQAPTPPPIYGAESSTQAAPVEDKTFRQKLADLFGPTDFVKVKNIDNQVFWWQYLPASKERQTVNRDYTDFVERDAPEQYSIEPSQTKILMGENAYIMLEALYKKMAAKKVIQATPDTPKHEARNFNFTDGAKQDTFINQAYLGKTDPFAQENDESHNINVTGQTEPTNTGGDDTPPPPGQGKHYEPKGSNS